MAHRFLATWLAIGLASASPKARLEEIDAWLVGGREAPKHWAVRAPGDLDGPARVLKMSVQKEVNRSTLRFGGAEVDVVVKALRHGGAFEFGDRDSDIAYFELLYLESLRGEPGVPRLYGGWRTPTSVVWVTSYGGDTVASHLRCEGGRELSRRGYCGARDKTDEDRPAIAGAAYARRAAEAPLELARSWLRCFRSFGEVGGFVLTDFKPDQFTLDGRGRVSLVDGPAPNTGRVAAFARRHFVAGEHIFVGRAPRPRPSPGESVRLDLEPGLPMVCDGATPCAARTHTWHAHAATSSAAPELGACDGKLCAAFDWRVHVYDLAARSWILPLIISLAEDRAAAARLEALSRAMLAADPAERPSFSALLRSLAQFGTGVAMPGTG